MKILITAGPTREPIDAVRYLTNFSSGKMGYALANSAKAHGHKVILVTGPVNLLPPKGVTVKQVETTFEMKQAVLKYLPSVDCLIMAAAVSDYRPMKAVKGKLKKSRFIEIPFPDTSGSRSRDAGNKEVINLKLVRNPDILKEIGAKNRNILLVGFALETGNLLREAQMKLKEKHLDYIVANSPSAFGSNKTDVVILNQQGIVKRFSQVSKRAVADFIIRTLERVK
jgi:phosphopantothenoylcysteine decarboxylase/phosphopantothenate--cysteine ligase